MSLGLGLNLLCFKVFLASFLDSLAYALISYLDTLGFDFIKMIVSLCVVTWLMKTQVLIKKNIGLN